MNWFVLLMPITKIENKESIRDIHITGDKKTKFAISNRTKYTSVKAEIANAGEPGHIFAGKYKLLTSYNI